MPWERSIGKASASKLRIYAKKDGRYDVSWYDQVGKRHVSTRKTLAAAKSFQAQKIAQLERHREGRFNLDDREMLSQARDLASIHGYTVLQSRRFDPARFGTCASFARFSSGTAEHL